MRDEKLRAVFPAGQGGGRRDCRSVGAGGGAALPMPWGSGSSPCADGRWVYGHRGI